MNYIGKVLYYWANPSQSDEDKGNPSILVFEREFNSFDDALKTVKNKAKQLSIGILKAKFNKYHKLPICIYFVKILNSWEVAEGKAKQGKLYDEWIEEEYKNSELFVNEIK